MARPERFDQEDVDSNEPDDSGLAHPDELRERSHALRLAGEGLLKEADGIDAAADEIEEGGPEEDE